MEDCEYPRIKHLIDTSNIHSLLQWIDILHFVKNSSDLTIEELRELDKASEMHREFWNNKDTITFIESADINPNIKQQIEELEKSNQI